MKLVPSLFLAATSACLFSTTAFADLKDDLAAVIKAQGDAPAYRAKVITSGGPAGANMTITMEKVKPNQMHVKTEGGPANIEIYSDGQKTLLRQGEGAFQEAPAQMAAMLTQNSQEVMMQQAIQSAKNVKVSGKDNVGGVAATIYSYDADVQSMHSANKLWVSDKDKRPIKSESEVKGNVATGAEGGTDINMKVTSTFDYDPSIKVVMPAK